MSKAHTSVAGVFLLMVMVSVGDYWMVAEQYLSQFDGVVVARHDFAPVLWTRTLATKYSIREADGSEFSYYMDPGQGHIDGYPVGTHLVKYRWRLDYEANGQPRNDFPFPIYFFWMTFNFGLLCALGGIAVAIRRRDRQTRELQAAVERGEQLLRASERER